MKRLLPLVIFVLSSNLLAQGLCETDLDSHTRTEQWEDVHVLVSTMPLFGQQVEVRTVDRSQLLEGHQLMAESLRGDTAIFVGLDSTGHMYLVANVYRYDGKFGFEKAQLRPRSSVLDRGMVARIEDNDGKLQDQIIAYLKKNGPPRSVDCSAGTCKVVGEATGLVLADTLKQKILPAELMKKLVTKGVRGADGREHKVQLFILGNAQPRTLLRAADKLSGKYTKVASSGSGAVLIGAGAVATFLGWFL